MKEINLKFKKILFINLFSILSLTVQACSNQQLGKELSESFEYSEELFPKVNAKKEIAKSSLKDNTQVNNSSSKAKLKNNKKPIKKIKQSKLPLKKNKLNRYKSQNYLVIIKIFDANSSAPGQTITNLLREEGVEFEVQKIEKIENKVEKKPLNILD